ncbi:multicilin [Gouania willdenowi]|uniref:multicilin n=1 Tax=Gouania willdenowi TaxID=441366 RepID=UPI0010547AD0|nr:multicilin [Gouania willdenowi]
MQRDIKLLTNQMGSGAMKTVFYNKDKALVPRSSSPVTVYVELPSITEQAFSTIAWDDLEERESEAGRDDLDSQVNGSNGEEADFGNYGFDFISDFSSTMESRLSPIELVPFQGCVIPPLTPNRDIFPEDISMVDSSTETSNPPAQNEAAWAELADCQRWALGHSIDVNNQIHNTLHRQQEEINSLEEKNHHLRQLASQAKHLASVLEKLMTDKEPNLRVSELHSTVKTSLSSCKRQRLDEGYETEGSESVEDILRDISTRCNAVLQSRTAGTQQQQAETIKMHGSFHGLQKSEFRSETGESVSSFITPIKEHCTIRTQVFPHGHAFTSRTQEGGYRFRWVPNHVSNQ